MTFSRLDFKSLSGLGRFSVYSGFGFDRFHCTSNFQYHQSSLGSSSSGSVCYVSEPQAEHFRFSSSRSSSIRCRRNVNLLERNVCLRIPFLQVSFPSPSKCVSRILQDHSYYCGLAKTSLVHISAASLCARPLLLFRVNLLSQLRGRILYPNPENMHLHAWLLSGRESDRKAFLSEKPTTSLRLSYSLQRLSTMQSGQSSLIGVLDGKLILSVSVQLADFFVHLFEDKGLLPSTIKCYRFSITRTLTISGET